MTTIDVKHPAQPAYIIPLRNKH
uniref:Uncharacterized protein n=1 Tax=Rhizophora mucronata TaxID=61149 RepID=A0A2P2R330_RHIMU